ncbi:MAG: hypothetical protein U0800_07760 [Isosphaeraceae bacterium]
MKRPTVGAVAVVAWLLAPPAALAGMPSVTLSDVAQLRFEAISFFLAILLLSSWLIQRIWNALRRDFAALPRLSYGKAVGLVVLWGLLFGLVLTMISGARELLTPGAWTKVGYTYKLNRPEEAAIAAAPDDAERRRGLEALRSALWVYANAHEGRFPADRDDPGIPAALWTMPDPAHSGTTYLYFPGRSPNAGEEPLVCERAIFGPDVYAMTASGAIRLMKRDELAEALKPGGEP